MKQNLKVFIIYKIFIYKNKQMASILSLSSVLKRLDEQTLLIKQQAEEMTELKRQLWQLKQANASMKPQLKQNF